MENFMTSPIGEKNIIQGFNESNDKLAEMLVSCPYDEINNINKVALRPKGKQFRSIICKEIAMAFDSRKVIPQTALESLELIQYFSLIHDDIIDKSEYRRGHLALWKEYSPDLALLYGDYLHDKALAIANLDAVLSDRDKNKLIIAFIDSSTAVQQGQMLEMINHFNLNLSKEQYYEIAKNKTGALIFLSAYIAWLYTSQDSDLLTNMSGFAYNFGVAFQIYNDLTDFIKGYGKDIMTDVISGKMTLPVILHCRNTGNTDPVLNAYKNKMVDEYLLKNILHHLKTTNAFKESLEIMNTFIELSQSYLVSAIKTELPPGIQNIYNEFDSLNNVDVFI